MAEEIKEFAEISEERWMTYCKKSKRTRWQGIDVVIILPDGTKVPGTDYWNKQLNKDEILNELRKIRSREVMSNTLNNNVSKRYVALEAAIDFIKNNYKDKVN